MRVGIEFHLASSFVSPTFSWDGQCTKPVVRGGGLNQYQVIPAEGPDEMPLISNASSLAVAAS
jgi:hypothetical protein